MELKFDDQALIPAIVQDVGTGQVLMLAYMNAEALAKTRESGETWFWSRSRQTLWHKGATSGNVQTVEEMRYDCDADALLVRVRPAGPACHTGEQSCFYRELPMDYTQPMGESKIPLSPAPYPFPGEKGNSQLRNPWCPRIIFPSSSFTR